jgi:hypothetical protein
MSAQTLTPTTRIPRVDEHLEAVFQSHGYQQEALVAEYARVRKEALAKIGEELTESQAYFDVKAFLSTDAVKRKAAQALAENSQSPIVSKETNLAILKQLIQDFYKGKKRPGLSAITVLKAVELINKMTGYESPIKQEIKAEHRVTCLPVIQTPFVGQLPILRVVDLAAEDGTVTSVSLGDRDEPAVDPEF